MAILETFHNLVTKLLTIQQLLIPFGDYSSNMSRNSEQNGVIHNEILFQTEL
jgi:hypothetical protein